MNTYQVLLTLLDRLWESYCDRVAYARHYRDLVIERGGRVVNDHIAFRTLNTMTGAQPPGIQAIARIFTPFGYVRAGEYLFEEKHLTAQHYAHPDPLLPKIFISQLEVAELPDECLPWIHRNVADARDRLGAEHIEQLQAIHTLSTEQADELVDVLYRFITERPWSPPRRSDVSALNEISQYAAWTLLHGNNVNHFTACINKQNLPEWPDIEATVAGLRQAGIPMKDAIEGEPGSKLRQTATYAVEEDVPVIDDEGRPATLRWTYAYYELAERGHVTDEQGRTTRFQGFLGPQAAQLFDMTRKKQSSQ